MNWKWRSPIFEKMISGPIWVQNGPNFSFLVDIAIWFKIMISSRTSDFSAPVLKLFFGDISSYQHDLMISWALWPLELHWAFKLISIFLFFLWVYLLPAQQLMHTWFALFFAYRYKIFHHWAMYCHICWDLFRGLM